MKISLAFFIYIIFLVQFSEAQFQFNWNVMSSGIIAPDGKTVLFSDPENTDLPPLNLTLTKQNALAADKAVFFLKGAQRLLAYQNVLWSLNGSRLYKSSYQDISWKRVESAVTKHINSSEDWACIAGHDLNWRDFLTSPLFEGHNITAATIDKQGSLWLVVETKTVDRIMPSAAAYRFEKNSSIARENAEKSDTTFTDQDGYYLEPNIIFYSGDKTIWLSSERMGTVYRSRDGGKTWERQKTPDRSVGAIYFRNDMIHGRIFGSSQGVVYETDDGGSSWKPLSDDYVRSPDFLNFFDESPSQASWMRFKYVHTFLKNVGSKVTSKPTTSSP